MALRISSSGSFSLSKSSEFDAGAVTPVTTQQTLGALAIIPNSKSITAGGTAQFTVGAVDSLGNPMAVPTGTWASSDSTDAPVDGNGLVTGVAATSAVIQFSVGAIHATASITVNAGSGGGSGYSKLKFDNMGYADQAAFLARVTAGSTTNDGDPGGTSVTTPAFYDAANWQFNFATSATQECLVVDNSTEAQYGGVSTLRQDFPPVQQVDKAPVLRIPLGAEYSAFFIRALVKFDSGSVSGRAAWTVAGDNNVVDYQTVYGSTPPGPYTSPPAEAYKFIAWGGGNTTGRLEYTGGIDIYEDQAAGMGNPDSGRIIDTYPEFSDNLWHEYIIGRFVDVTNKIRMVKVWMCDDGGTPTYIGGFWARNDDGSDVTTCDIVRFGLNYNQFRSVLYSLWRGPWEIVDLSVNTPTVVATAYGIAANDVAEYATPTAPTVVYSSSTDSSLSYSVTAPSGITPLEVVPEVLISGTWTAQVPVRWTAGVAGTQVIEVTGLSASTNYSSDIRFSLRNLAGTGSTTLATTGTTAVNLGMPAGCVWGFLVDGNTDVSTDGASASTWNDVSGSGLQFAYVGTKPVLKTAQLNGHSILRFSGGAAMQMTTNPTLMGTEGTVILVAKFADTSNCTPLDSDGSWYFLNNAGGYALITPNGQYLHNEATYPISTTAWKYLSYRGRSQFDTDGGPVNFNVDDAVVESSTDGGTTTMHGASAPILGNNAALSSGANMDVAAVYAFDHYLSDTDLAAAAAQVRTLFGTGNFA